MRYRNLYKLFLRFLSSSSVTAIIFIMIPHLLNAETDQFSKNNKKSENYVAVPIVGCREDGSGGMSSIKGRSARVALPDLIARQLSVYVGEKLAILAPRGWVCSGSSGPDYLELDVYPKSGGIEGNALVSEQTWVAESAMGTSRVLAYGGRYFPWFVSRDEIQDFINRSQLNSSVENFIVSRVNLINIHYIKKNIMQFDIPAGQASIENDGKIYSLSTSKGLLAIRDEEGRPYQIYILVFRSPSHLSSIGSSVLAYSENCLVQEWTDYCPIDPSQFDDSN